MRRGGRSWVCVLVACMLASGSAAVQHEAFEVPNACFTPDTPQEYVDEIAQSQLGERHSLFPNVIGGPEFNIVSRWSATATDGGGLGQGDPTTLTWSYVPDGTLFANICFVPGEQFDTSDFQAFFTSVYGNFATWHQIFVDMFARWSELTGNVYIYEPNDDGVPFATFIFPGVVGVRGDIRIGGHFIDGDGPGVLACNYFPDNGDMILDTAHVSFYTAANALGVRNVLAHEHGHGLGIAHVCPVNRTKLMEPFITTAFDGPQFDDILAAQRHYGDPHEHNDLDVTATDLGAIVSGGNVDQSQVSIDDNSDINFYKFTVDADQAATLHVNPAGAPYLSGPQIGSSCTAGTMFDPRNVHNLSMSLLATDGTTVLASANANPAGQGETLFNMPLPGAGTYFVRVSGDTTNSIQAYALNLAVNDNLCGDGNLDAGEECDDGNHDDGDGCSARCAIEPMPLCPATPQTGCFQQAGSGTGLLQLKDKADDTKDALTWKWLNGAATTKADFGDPLTSTDYALCLYDETGDVPSLVLEANAPAGDTCGNKPCWKMTSKGFKYKDKDRTSDGLEAIILAEGAAGQAKITLTGKGGNLDLPGLPLAQDATVTAQLVHSDGGCWEAQYSVPAAKNKPNQFKDKGD